VLRGLPRGGGVIEALVMKIVHAADLHLDSPLLGLERYEGAPVHRIRGATRRALENLVRFCVDEEVKLLLVAGDLYDDDWRDYSTALFFRRQMLELARAGARVVWIRGNHDAASQLQKHLDLPEEVFELSVKRPESRVFEDLGVAVHGQGFATRAVIENLAASYPEPLPGLVNIGLLHTSVAGHPGHAPYAPCSLEDLRARGYDYWALGHVHQRTVLSRDPWVVFPGNLQGRHARETGDKGATVLEVDAGRVTSVGHQSFSVVRWAVCEVDASGAADPDELLGKVRDALALELEQSDGSLCAVRLHIQGETPAHAALVHHSERWLAEVRALSSELGGEDLWLEKVEWKTRAPVSIGELARRDDAIGQTFRGLAELRESAERRSDLRRELAELGTRLPLALRVGPMALDLAAEDTLDGILDDVEQLLLPLLSEEEA